MGHRVNQQEDAELSRMIARMKARAEEHERRYNNDPEYREEIDRERFKKMLDEAYESADKNFEQYERRVETLPKRHRRELEKIPRSAWGKLWNELADIWTGKESVLLVGPEGSGKTTAMTWAAEWHAVRGGWVDYVTVTLFAEYVRDESKLRGLKHAGVLIIDEIHRFDSLPDWITTALIGLIDYRYYQEAPTLAAGTLPPSKIASVVGVEIVKRFDHRIGTDETSYRK